MGSGWVGANGTGGSVGVDSVSVQCFGDVVDRWVASRRGREGLCWRSYLVLNLLGLVCAGSSDGVERSERKASLALGSTDMPGASVTAD